MLTGILSELRAGAVVQRSDGRSESRRLLRTISPQDAEPSIWAGAILGSKLRQPAISDAVVARRRIDRMIREGDRPLVLVVAPPGFGKTIAAAQWAAGTAGWLTIDASDESFARFCAHLREALAFASPGVGNTFDDILASPRMTSPRDLGRALAGELQAATAPIRVVLDDLHKASGGDVSDFLHGLLESPPPQLRLFITARFEPALPLANLRLHGNVTEIRGADLLFTSDEISALLATVPGDEEGGRNRAADVLARTTGWAAGVRLAVLSDSAEESVQRPGDQEAALLDALLDETLAGIPAAQRRALVYAAIPERFTSDLLAAIAPEQAAASASALAFARAADLCRPSPAAGTGWWEFHALYRSALLHQLGTSESPGSLAALHRATADAFAAAGQPAAELLHRVSAGDYDAAIELLERLIPETLDREEWPRLADWLQTLPGEIVDTRPRLLLARGWVAHLRGRHMLLREIITLAEASLARETPDDAAIRELTGELDVLRVSGSILSQVDPERAARICTAALAQLPASGRYTRGFAEAHLAYATACGGDVSEAERLLNRQWTTASHLADASSLRGLLTLTMLYLQRGDTAAANLHATWLHELAEQSDLRLTLCWARCQLAFTALLRGSIDEAIAFSSQVAREHHHANLVCLRESLFVRAIAVQLSGRPEDARECLEWSQNRLIADGAAEHLPILAAQEAWLALLRGDIPAAAAWARGSAPGIDTAPLQLVIHPVLVQAAALCAAGTQADRERSIELLAQFRDRAGKTGFTLARAQAESIEAIARLGAGESLADDATVEVPEIWQRQLAAIFPSARTLPELDPLKSDTNQASSSTPDARDRKAFAPSATLAMLSRREREILEQLALGRSYSEIADQCFVSPHTVKRHVANIYRKLDVGSRKDAVAVALGGRQ